MPLGKPVTGFAPSPVPLAKPFDIGRVPRLGLEGPLHTPDLAQLIHRLPQPGFEPGQKGHPERPDVLGRRALHLLTQQRRYRLGPNSMGTFWLEFLLKESPKESFYSIILGMAIT